MTEPTIAEVIASLLARLEVAGAISGSLDVDTTVDGRDYQLVWGCADDNSIEATIWDDTGDDPVQIANVRLTVQVIA